MYAFTIIASLTIVAGLLTFAAITFKRDKHPTVDLPKEGDVVQRRSPLAVAPVVRVHHAGWR